MNQKYLLSITVSALLGFSSVVLAQSPDPEAETKQVTLNEISIERASLGGASGQWAKIIIDFSTIPSWADGIAFSCDALLKEGEDRFRVVSGVVRYGNVQSGNHRGYLYMSPSAVRRYGTPVAIKCEAFYQDKEVDLLTWAEKDSYLELEWMDYNRYGGVLVNLLSTPWIVQDYAKAPDILAIR